MPIPADSRCGGLGVYAGVGDGKQSIILPGSAGSSLLAPLTSLV